MSDDSYFSQKVTVEDLGNILFIIYRKLNLIYILKKNLVDFLKIIYNGRKKA